MITQKFLPPGEIELSLRHEISQSRDEELTCVIHQARNLLPMDIDTSSSGKFNDISLYHLFDYFSIYCTVLYEYICTHTRISSYM